MSLQLPTISHAARTAVNDALPYVATLKSPGSRLATFPEAVRGARKSLDSDNAVKSINYVCLRANGELWLIEISRKSWKQVWNFGMF